MEGLLGFARGPLLVFAFAALALGLVRQLVLTGLEIGAAYRRATVRPLPVAGPLRRVASWMVPLRAMRGGRAPYTVASVVLHVGLLAVPLLLDGHIALVQRAFGLAWPALPAGLADILTLASLVAVAALVAFRLGSPAARTLSRFQDWALLGLIAVAFLTGYWVAHPAAGPMAFETTYLLHLLSAEALLVLIPFSKLSHAALLPLAHISWDVGWHFVPGAGDRVRAALGKEGEPV